MRVMDDSVGIRYSEGWVWRLGRRGWKSCKGQGGEIVALLSGVPHDTTNLTMPEVATRIGLVELVGSAGGHQVGAMTVETGCGAFCHGCSTDDVMKS